MAMSKLAASMPAPPMYQVPTADIRTKLQDISNLLSVASTLQVKQITSYSKDGSDIRTSDISSAIITKISEHPRWDKTLSAKELESITPHLALIKTTLNEKSYGWAWFLKQTGKKEESKKLLAELFNQEYERTMKLEGTYNNISPMIEINRIEQALTPMSSKSENAEIKKKMDQLKVHVSNLKDYMIMT